MGIVKLYKKNKKKLIRKTSSEVTKEDILSGLHTLGLKSTDTVFIHSSLSKFGNVSGGAKTVLDGVMEYFTQGTILFPGFNIKGTAKESALAHASPENPFNYKTSIPSTGILCRVFKTDYCTDISIHPTHSVLGAGLKSRVVTQGHLEANSTFGQGTPFAKLLELKGKITGLGSDFGHVTFFHTIEDLKPDFPNQVYENQPITVFLFNEQHEIVSKAVKIHCAQKSRIERPSGTYIRKRFWNKLKKNKTLTTTRIGEAICWSVPAQDLYDLLVNEMKNGKTIYSEAPNFFSRKFNELMGWLHEINR